MIFDKPLSMLRDKTQINPNTMADISVGHVESIEPIQIKIDNNIMLTDDFISLSDLCKEYKVEDEEIILENVEIELPPIYFTSHGEEHVIKSQKIIAPAVKGIVKTLRLWKDLEKGEQVNMIRSHGGQTYFVVDRERI